VADTVPEDSTVASVWAKLKEPRQYIAGVRQKLMTCVSQHGNAEVKIGVTGRGYQPCYRITYKVGNVEHIYGSYWDNHQPLGRQDAVGQNWASTSMAAYEVDSFLKEKIGWKAPKAS
jgi:hypothetical protein